MKRQTVMDRAARFALCAWVAFALLAALVISQHGIPFSVDSAILSWSLVHRPDAAGAAARALTATGSALIPYVLVTWAGAWVGRTSRRRVQAAALGLLCLTTGQLARYGVMALIHRSRPPRADWAATASGWAFPSGHTTTAAITAGILLLALRIRAPHGKNLWMAVVVCWGLTVGMTRAYLAVHWSTDVLGGWLFATGWLALYVWAGSRWLPEQFSHRTTSPVGKQAKNNGSP